MLISQVPVNRGCWVTFSANIQPTDHTSTGAEYFKPSRSSDHQTKQEFDSQVQFISPSIFLIPHSDHHRIEESRVGGQRRRVRWRRFGGEARRDFGCRRGKMRGRNSVTMKVSSDMIKEMNEEAEKVWVPEMVKLIKETKEPFINVIYDCDPLEQIVWDNVVLVGDAAHPILDSSRITNMAILDAAVLGKSLEKRGAENLHSALGEFQSIRLPVVLKQVLHSRYVGRIKQGLVLSDRNPFYPMIAKPEECQILLQKSVPFLGNAPSILL
ncbi:hypothetical protein ACSBR2_012423 [Camellia fascicularis]